MTGNDLIDAVIGFYDNTLVTDADNALRRTRVTHNAQMVLDEVWNQRAWPFKMKQSTVSMVSGLGTLPTDFARFGPEGVVWHAPTKKIYTEALPQDLIAIRNRGDQYPKLFAVTATDGSTKKLMIPETTSLTLSVFYETQAPVFEDDSNDITGIPGAYHRTVLLAGTVSRTQMDKNDVRIYWEKQYLQGLARMIVNELPLQTRNKQLPMAVGKRMW